MKVLPIFTLPNKTINFKSAVPKLSFECRDTVDFGYKNCDYSRQVQILREFDEKIDIILSKIKEIGNQRTSRTEVNALRARARELILKKAEISGIFNGNIKILYDKNNFQSRINRYLDMHPEIIPINSLEGSEREEFVDLWHNRDFFVTDKTPFGVFLDSSYEPNRVNFERLTGRRFVTAREMGKKYEINLRDIQKYSKYGIFRPLTLKNLISGKEVPTPLFDIENDETNIKGVEGYRKFHTPLEVYQCPKGEYISPKQLANLGFATEEKIFEMIIFGQLVGKFFYKKTEYGTKKDVALLFNDPETKTKLKALRAKNPDTVGLMAFSRMAKADIAEIEASVMKDELSIIPCTLYPEDDRRMLINLKKRKNVEFLNRKKFEQAVLSGKSDRLSSVSQCLIYDLCPHTRDIGRFIAETNPVIVTILENSEYQKLNKDELAKIKMYSDMLWEKAGRDEYEKTTERIKTALEEYKLGGVENIKDEEARKALLVRLKAAKTP